MTLIISCGEEKLKTVVPVQAKNLYIGPVFTIAWNKATTLDPDVRILSAGYGLLKPNDLVLPYERRMIGRIATYIRKHTPPIENSGHLMAFLYGKAVPFAQPLLPKSLTLGHFIAAIQGIPDGPFKYTELENGEIKTMLPLESLRQEHRGRNGSCLAMRDFLLSQFADVHEICLFLEKNFGPPIGSSYMPTVRTQLRVLPKKYNLTVTRKGNRFKFNQC